jgi:xylulokinase
MAIIAGVDTSTQSCTVSLFDSERGRCLGEGRAPHSRAVPPVSEQDPREWWEALRHALADTTRSTGIPPDRIEAIAIAGQCHGLVPLDGADAIIRPAKLWNDTTSAGEAAWLVERLSAAEWARLTGSVPTAAFTISKIAWLAANEPANFAELRHVLLPHDYLTFMLTGRKVTDRSEASGTGYFDGATNTWRPELLDLIDDRIDWLAMLPRVHAPAQMAGQLSASAAEQTGLRAGIPVGPGAGDQHAAALALGVDSGDILISLGTSGVVLTRSDVPVADDSGLVTGVCDASGRFLPLVCTLNGTQVTDTVAALLRVSVDELSRLALAEPAGRADRPVLAPFLGGERAPNLPSARGLLGGLGNDLSRGQLARAAFEGVLLGLLAGADAIAALGLELTGRLLVTGGGSRSPAYCQFLADLAQREVSALDLPDATVRGAALQAAAVLTENSLELLQARWTPQPARLVAPRPAAAEIVRARFAELSAWPRHRRPWEEKP